MFKYPARDSSTNWVLLGIHEKEKRKYKGEVLSFWAKLNVWLKGKL